MVFVVEELDEDVVAVGVRGEYICFGFVAGGCLVDVVESVDE